MARTTVIPKSLSTNLLWACMSRVWKRPFELVCVYIKCECFVWEDDVSFMVYFLLGSICGHIHNVYKPHKV